MVKYLLINCCVYILCHSTGTACISFFPVFCYTENIRNHTTGGLLCEQENADDPCPDEHGQYVVPAYMAIYMLFTNILLLNLLIAIFK